MTSPRVFTLEEINALVPRLNELVSRQLTRRLEIESRLRTLGDMTGETPTDLGLTENDGADVRQMKRELASRVDEYQTGWRDIEDLGGVLKDARHGLVDFYGTVEGRVVWLTWRYGDKEVRHYHALDEGFSGRKEIRESIKVRLLN